MLSTEELLQKVKSGEVSVQEALLELKKAPFEDIGFAKVDLHRKIRQDAAEVIYGAGKTSEQIAAIADTMIKNGQTTILITRLSEESANEINKRHELKYDKVSKTGIANIVIGITKDVRVATLNPKRAITEIIKPKKTLPVSPTKTLAGGKL